MTAPARLARWLALSGLLALVACGDDREPLVVAAASGARIDLTGTTWEICLEDAPEPGRSERFREVHGEDGAVTAILESYVGPGCTGETDGPARAGSAVARTRGDVVVPFSEPPPEGLDPPPPATRVEFESGGFIVGRDVYLVNDTGPRRALHTGVPAAPRDGAGYPTLLLSQGALEP